MYIENTTLAVDMYLCSAVHTTTVRPNLIGK